MKLSLSEISRLWPIAKRRTGEKIISWVQRLFSSDRLVRDVFGRGRGKRVLMCHLPEAFTGKELPKHHSNLTECHVVARCFDRLGYSVDCSSRTKTGIDYAPYDIVFGINGNAFMGSFGSDGKPEPLRIFYSVGAETCFNYRHTSIRNLDFHRRHGRWILGSNRYMPGDPRNYYEAHFSDAVICLGNEYVYRQFLAEESCGGRYSWLPAFYFKAAEPAKEKDFSLCRRNILWFGSSGMLHKGLDIAIDFVVAHPEFTLHICGGSRQESAFWEHYMPVIKANGNIVMHGFVNIGSQEFVNILSQCGVLLNPSVSEGGAVAVLNVLGNGALLPVCSRATGIDIDGYGTIVDEMTYDAFEQALIDVDKLPLKEFGQRAWDAYKDISVNYTVEKYEENMYNLLKGIIDGKRK